MKHLKKFNEDKEDLGIMTTHVDINEFKWIEVDNKLQRKFEMGDFNQALAFINKLAPICESMNHHPQINWVYNKIELTLSTHDAGDKITELDYQLANKIDEIGL